SCGLAEVPLPTGQGGSDPVSLPTRTASPWPTATRTPTATATGTASPTATASGTPQADTFSSPLQSPLEPSPTVTDTPPPTPTPTPPPTPFPAGDPTKLGLFVAWYHPQIMDLVATGNVALIKTLELDPNFLREIKARSPETLIVGRVTLGQLDLSQADGGRALAEARRAVDAIRPLALDERRLGLVDAWEGHNEPVPGDVDQMRLLADVEAERVRLLAEDGLRAVVGNFGTGQPPLEWWPAFRPALEAAAGHGGYLGLHEYAAPTMWYHTNVPPLDFSGSPGHEGWLTLRYRKVYRQYLQPWGLNLPLLITECGVDGLVADRPGPPGRGWQDFAGYWADLGMGWDTPGNYVEQLAWYDRELQLDDYVRGAAIFAMTVFEEWRSYQLQGDAAGILQQYLSVHPVR
ncbi:MAG: hypothetical protein P8129_15155, partial [Anaerolineae bacterium]